MHPALTPKVDLEGFERFVFTYDAEDDIVYFHFDAPRAAITERIGEGWYLRIAGEEVVGMELHGLQRSFLNRPFYAAVFEPAIAELEQHTARTLDHGFSAAGSLLALPRTTHLIMFLIGQSIGKYEALQRTEAEDAGRNLLAAS